jgi:hypothetical protein
MSDRRPRRSRILKKLPPDAGFGGSPSSALDPGRNLVPGRGPDWPEERPDLPMGEERHATPPGQGSSLQECLHLRRHLPGQGDWRRAGDAIRRHPCHAAPSHGNQSRYRSWCPCRITHGPGWHGTFTSGVTRLKYLSPRGWQIWSRDSELIGLPCHNM